MADLGDLYQELILDHSKRPRHFKAISAPDRRASGSNPLCGDCFTVSLKLEGEVVSDIGVEGDGCAISRASASMMAASIVGKSRSEAGALFQRFHRLITEGREDGDLGKLAVFAGVRAFPVRVKCATLAWHTLKAALEGSAGQVSTEAELERADAREERQ